MWKAKWRGEWASSPRYAKFKHIDPSLPSCKFIKLISNSKLSRADDSKIFQLWMGHVPLNVYLHCFKRKDSVQCPACRAHKETLQHFLLECPVYAYKRWKLRLRKREIETKFAEILRSGKESLMLVHYDEQHRCMGWYSHGVSKVSVWDAAGVKQVEQW